MLRQAMIFDGLLLEFDFFKETSELSRKKMLSTCCEGAAHNVCVILSVVFE